MNEHLEGILHIDARSKHFKQLTDRFGGLKLHHILVFSQTTLDVSDETSRHPLVDGCVFNQTLLNVTNQLALCDAGTHFALGYLVKQLQTRHRVLLFKFEEKEQRLVLHETILAAIDFVLELTDRLFDDLGAVTASFVKFNHAYKSCRHYVVRLVIKCLLNELFEALYILLVDNFSQHS